MSPDAFLDLAKQILEQAEQDLTAASCRTVAGRCYYSLFLTLLHLARDSQNPLTGTGVDHSIIRRALAQAKHGSDPRGRAVTPFRTISEQLHLAKRWRRRADYKLHETEDAAFSRTNMETLVSDTEQALATIDELAPEEVASFKSLTMEVLPETMAEAEKDLRKTRKRFGLD